MDQETILKRGHLAAAEQRRDELDITIEGQLQRLRLILDFFQDDLCKIKVEEALIIMQDLNRNVHELRDLSGRILRLKESLNIIA